MIRYGCPNCHKRAFDAASVVPVRIELKCGDCKKVVDAVPLYLPETNMVPAQRTLQCTTCERTQHVERPKNDRSYCVSCGTDTLVIVAEMGAVEITRRVPYHKRPVEARKHARNS